MKYTGVESRIVLNCEVKDNDIIYIVFILQRTACPAVCHGVVSQWSSH